MGQKEGVGVLFVGRAGGRRCRRGLDIGVENIAPPPRLRRRRWREGKFQPPAAPAISTPRATGPRLGHHHDVRLVAHGPHRAVDDAARPTLAREEGLRTDLAWRAQRYGTEEGRGDGRERLGEEQAVVQGREDAVGADQARDGLPDERR